MTDGVDLAGIQGDGLGLDGIARVPVYVCRKASSYCQDSLSLTVPRDVITGLLLRTNRL